MKKSGIVMIEAAFVVALLFLNLIMGEFERNGLGSRNGLSWACWNVFTAPNVAMGALALAAAYFVIGFARDAPSASG